LTKTPKIAAVKNMNKLYIAAGVAIILFPMTLKAMNMAKVPL
jgi:hypothetical protein